METPGHLSSRYCHARPSLHFVFVTRYSNAIPDFLPARDNQTGRLSHRPGYQVYPDTFFLASALRTIHPGNQELCNQEQQ